MKNNLMAALVSFSTFGSCTTTPAVYQAQAVSAGQAAVLPSGLVGLGIAIDIVRSNNGRLPLTPDIGLRLAAEQHATVAMQSNRVWAFSGNGASPYGRLGLSGPDGRFIGLVAGETFAPLPDLLHEWLSKPGSRDLLLEREARTIGMADKVGLDGRHWVVIYIAK
jgi:hypothetical protein